ncbi:Bacterial regulatory protein, tetR family [Hartmannibacter diazotrophicus]|uniref:Bacterial regulatory protein, tetR family n=1 Tax=Hartmannibacter diazotrophicus TaxID=1482074 RepID=A0A2C9DDG5_9HYPH|nr:WHG domain-containing protein [Hartmannibacter diazotrophicus]SON58382.1 Bacterial regulatory protein, tetR family [Hartmannibacter diazotrophicus]
MTSRREAQRDALITTAETIISQKGLGALRARDLATEVGCAVGAIYTYVEDLDELVLRVGVRTLSRLGEALQATTAETLDASPREQLTAIALTYADFAAGNVNLWRALFEFRLSAHQQLPEWSAGAQTSLFTYLDAPLKTLLPDLSDEDRQLLARTLFSAVHGVVALGLEDRHVAVPRAALHAQIRMLVAALAVGLPEVRQGG